ncbi:MAG: hypothetical protein WC992_03755 [Acholeplasmataceae bacterium]|jgi:hypothetical protein|nr:hypothetical protein [Acholeplasmataceae bacterium]
MIPSYQFKQVRYIMIGLAVGLLIIDIVSYIILRPYMLDETLSIINIGLNIVFSLALIFIHPKYHRFIGIPYAAKVILSIILTVTVYQNFPFHQLNLPQILLFIYQQGSSVIAMAGFLYIFFKPKSYHISDFIILGSIALINTPLMITQSVNKIVLLGEGIDSIGEMIAFMSQSILGITFFWGMMFCYIYGAKEMDSFDKTLSEAIEIKNPT